MAPELGMENCIDPSVFCTTILVTGLNSAVISHSGTSPPLGTSLLFGPFKAFQLSPGTNVLSYQPKTKEYLTMSPLMCFIMN